MTTAAFGTTTYVPDQLIAQNAHLLLDEPITLLSGQNLVRGAVLGRITASGKYTLSLSASSDGSQTPVAVLAIDCNASGGDKATVAYFRGDFIGSGLTFGTGHSATTAATKAALRTANIELIAITGGV